MATRLQRLIPTIQSIKIVEENLKKRKKKNIIEQGTSNILGVVITKETANFLS